MSTPDIVSITQLLCAAAGADQSARTQAFGQLQELEARPGCASLLLDAYADEAANQQGRYLAVLLCKNVIDRRWQPRSGQCFTPEEKQLVKDKLLQLAAAAIQGQLPHLVELSAVLRKVCRFDFPLQWEGLVLFLVAQLRECEHQPASSPRTVAVSMLLHDILKEQASKRLLGARKAFFQVAQVLLEPVGKFWVATFTSMRQDRQRCSSGDELTWKLSRYADGSFLILLLKGFAHLHEAPSGAQMVSLVQDKVAFLLDVARTAPQLLHQCPFYVKNLKSLVKWWSALMEQHPLAFSQANIATVLHTCVEILKEHASLRAGLQERAPWEALMRRCLEMLRHAVDCNSVRLGPQEAQSESPETLELARTCHEQFRQFLEGHPVASLADLACVVALQLPGEDLQAWLEEPECELLGPNSQTDLRLAGEGCIRTLATPPLDVSLVGYVAQRTQTELASPSTVNDPFETVVRKDTLLALFSLVQAQLKGHLAFQQLMSIFMPIAQLVPQMEGRSLSTLLVLRICTAIKSWVDSIPSDAVLPVLQILLSFLQEGRPKAVRLAALVPVQEVLKSFSDHEAWAQIHSPMIDACLSLLSALHEPDTQWRCLNLVQLFLSEEASSGGYEVTEPALKRMLQMWKTPEGSELLLCHALLDVFRAMVLMSCWARKPRIAVSTPLLSCCMAVISDCFTNLTRYGAPVSCPDSMLAALEADAVQAAGRLGERGGAVSTVIDSGALLLLALLRVVEVEQAKELMPLFPQLLAQSVQQPIDSLQDTTLEILLEYCVLSALPGLGSGNAGDKFNLLAQLCKQCIEASSEQRTFEPSFRILQLLLASGPPKELLRPVLEFIEKLFQRWLEAHMSGSAAALKHHAASLVTLFFAWQANHKQHFQERAKALTPDLDGLAVLFLNQTRSLRALASRVAGLTTALALVESTGGSEEFWRTCMQHLMDLLTLAKKRGILPDLMQVFNVMRSKLSVRLPTPVRVNCELLCSTLPQALHGRMRDGDAGSKETAPVEWFFGHLGQTLKQLSAAQPQKAAAVLAAAPQELQNALLGTAGAQLAK